MILGVTKGRSIEKSGSDDGREVMKADDDGWTFQAFAIPMIGEGEGHISNPTAS